MLSGGREFCSEHITGGGFPPEVNPWFDARASEEVAIGGKG